jgi:hypothetical protein
VSADREELLAAGYAALAQLQYAHDVAVETVVNEIQHRTGERLLVRRPGVLDARYSDLAEMAEQTHRYAQAWRLFCTQVQPDDPRRLGTVLKVIPAHVAHEITGHLRAAGVLPADGPARSR